MSGTATVLILPGLFNSGEGHWQTVWESTLPNARRVQQSNWDCPDRIDWVAALDAAIASAQEPVVLAAHSLGCALTAWWSTTGNVAMHGCKVRGALLVAPPDVERNDFPAFVTGFSPMPRQRLPFRTIVAASSDDPWCAQNRARDWAGNWGAHFHDMGPRGHINAESGLGDWQQGRTWLRELGA
ncbi:MAG TPA: alpha/beta hydrolase [Noviherbaspirillum sp.]|jgi:predicted alpha/beta hydrolase family esterase|uniref:RBBP9/YdeN family alpha/beta hydrolase n=1 Tax=Noviherbaspirillum sp. TaxID=1926288 RepID=UPI002F93F84B